MPHWAQNLSVLPDFAPHVILFIKFYLICGYLYNMERKNYIYGLSGNDGIIRYVGKSYRPFYRKHEHLAEARGGYNNFHKSNWIRKLLSNGDSLNVIILEECKNDNWEEREKFWISTLPNLTNSTDGGDGACGYKIKTTYSETKEWIKTNIPQVNTESKWREYVKENELPNFIPKRPDNRYRFDGWISWTDFFGVEKKFMNYNELKDWVTPLKLTSKRDYLENKTNIMPTNPEQFYKDSGWVGWYSFLGNEKVKTIKTPRKRCLTYSELQVILKPLLFTKKIEYTNWYKTYDNPEHIIPYNPPIYFKNRGWISWVDFFGNNLPKNIKYKGRQKQTHFLSYTESKLWVKINLPIVNSENIWRTVTKSLPNFIPKRPDYVYKNNGWTSWIDFFKV